MPLPHPLLAGARYLRGGDPAAARGQSKSLGGVPLRLTRLRLPPGYNVRRSDGRSRLGSRAGSAALSAMIRRVAIILPVILIMGLTGLVFLAAHAPRTWAQHWTKS